MMFFAKLSRFGNSIHQRFAPLEHEGDELRANRNEDTSSLFF
jgi:hypothetical protein